jgi:hypothetical protein
MTKLWGDDNEHPSLTRCNRIGVPYQMTHERYIPPSGEGIRNNFRGYSISAYETQQNEQDPEETNKPQQRRRIPVAVRISCDLKNLHFLI